MSSAVLGGHLQATWPTEGRCSMLEVGRRFAHLANLASDLQIFTSDSSTLDCVKVLIFTNA